MTDWQERHEEQHQDDERARVNGRRWIIGTCIAAMLLLVAIMTLVLDLLGRVHG